MALYPSHQLIWQDNTGEHLFVSSYANSFMSAMTLALALQSTQSAHAIKIVKVEEIQTGGIQFELVWKWGTWKE